MKFTRRLIQLIALLTLMALALASAPGVQARTLAGVAPLGQPADPPPPPPVPGGDQARTPYVDSLADSSSADIVPASATALATAMGISSSAIVSASLGTTDPLGVGVGNASLGAFFPTQGSTFAILSTGLAKSAQTANSEKDLSYVLNGLNNSQPNDMVQLKLKLHVPSTAKCASFDFQYLSEEFPEWVDSTFNDTFTAEKGGTSLAISGNTVSAPLNFAFDTAGHIISVNTVLGVSAGTGTTYDGATGLLRARTPVSPGTDTMFVFTVQDLGDSIYDSAVFMDRWTWTSTTCTKGASVVTYGVSLQSAGSQDGWILESNETSGVGGTMNASNTTIRLGDSPAKQQYRSILSFGTATLPDTAVIASAKLRMRYSALAGSNPFASLGNILVDIRKGPFSGNAALQLGDFQAAPSLNAGFSFTNSPSGTGWYSSTLPSGSFGYINKKGLTQFRLRFKTDDNNNSVADYLSFFSGNATITNRPILNVLYHMP